MEPGGHGSSQHKAHESQRGSAMNGAAALSPAPPRPPPLSPPPAKALPSAPAAALNFHAAQQSPKLQPFPSPIASTNVPLCHSFALLLWSPGSDGSSPHFALGWDTAHSTASSALRAAQLTADLSSGPGGGGGRGGHNAAQPHRKQHMGEGRKVGPQHTNTPTSAPKEGGRDCFPNTAASPDVTPTFPIGAEFLPGSLSLFPHQPCSLLVLLSCTKHSPHAWAAGTLCAPHGQLSAKHPPLLR